MKNKYNKKGFTLLEMLIVLGIIALIVTITAVSYTIIQKKSRDSKRKNDIKLIQGAFEQYYAVCGYTYPNIQGLSYTPSIICTSPTTAILPTPPLDPKSGVTYTIIPPGTARAGYTVCATLESETPTNYCLSNQQ